MRSHRSSRNKVSRIKTRRNTKTMKNNKIKKRKRRKSHRRVKYRKRTKKIKKTKRKTKRKIGRSLKIQKGGDLLIAGTGIGGDGGGGMGQDENNWYANEDTIKDFLGLNATIIKDETNKMNNLKARKEILIADFTNYYRLSVYKLIDIINIYLEGVAPVIGCPCHVVVSGGDGFNSNLHANQRVISPDIDVKVIMRLDRLEELGDQSSCKPDELNSFILKRASLWTNMYKKLVYHVEKIVDCIVNKLNGDTDDGAETCTVDMDHDMYHDVRSLFYIPERDELYYEDFKSRQNHSKLQDYIGELVLDDGSKPFDMDTEYLTKLNVEAATGTNTNDSIPGYAWARRTNDMEAGGQTPPYTLNNVKLISIDLRYKYGEYFGSLAGVLDIVIAVPGHIGWDHMCEPCMYLPTFGDEIDDGGSIRAGDVWFPRMHDIVTANKWNLQDELHGLHVYFITLDYYTYECFKMIKLGLRTKNGKIIKDLNRYYTLRLTGELCDSKNKLREVECSVETARKQFPSLYGVEGELAAQMDSILKKIEAIDAVVTKPGGLIKGGACGDECKKGKGIVCGKVEVDWNFDELGVATTLVEFSQEPDVSLDFGEEYVVDYHKDIVSNRDGGDVDVLIAALALVKMKNCNFTNDDQEFESDLEQINNIKEEYENDERVFKDDYFDNADGSGGCLCQAGGYSDDSKMGVGTIMKGGGYKDGNQGINTPSIGKILKMLNIYDVCVAVGGEAAELIFTFMGRRKNEKIPTIEDPFTPPSKCEGHGGWGRLNYEKQMVGVDECDILVRPPKDCYGPMAKNFTTNAVFGKSSINNFTRLFTFLTECAKNPALVCLMAQFKYYGDPTDKLNATVAANYIFSSIIQGLNPNKILSKMKSVLKKKDAGEENTIELLKKINDFYKEIGKMAV
jgi:hypothetical protein